MALIDKETIRAEIEFAKSVYSNPKRVVHGVADAFRQDGRVAMCDDILKKLDSLPEQLVEKQEQPMSPKDKFVFPNFLYARTVDNKTIDVSYVPQSLDAVEYVKNNLTKQSAEDLEEEIKRMIYDVVYDLNGPAIIGTSEYLSVEDIADIARYFAEWGAKQKSIEIFKKQNCQGCGTQRCTGDGEWLEGCKVFQAWKAEHLKK